MRSRFMPNRYLARSTNFRAVPAAATAVAPAGVWRGHRAALAPFRILRPFFDYHIVPKFGPLFAGLCVCENEAMMRQKKAREDRAKD